MRSPEEKLCAAGLRVVAPAAPGATADTGGLAGRMPVVCSRWEQASALSSAGTRVGSVDELLGKDAQRVVTAYAEFRHLAPAAQWLPLELEPPFGLYHAFTLLELDEGRAILCVERHGDPLELLFLIGDPQSAREHAACFRATGESRLVTAASPVIEHVRVDLKRCPGPQPLLSVRDFRRWVLGPLAAGWRPHSTLLANCQHFAQELQAFIRSPMSSAGFAAADRGHAGLLSALRSNGALLEGAPPEVRQDRELVLAAVRACGSSLQWAGEDLRADKDVVLAAVKADGLALAFAADSLRADRAFVLSAVRTNHCALRHAADRLRRDREVVTAAVHRCGASLEFADEDLRREKGLVLSAVLLDGNALSFAGQELRGDREVALAAVAQNGGALAFVAEPLRKDPGVAGLAVRQHGLALQYASEDLRADRDIVSVAVARHGMALGFVSEPLRRDREIVLDAVTQCGAALQFASEDLRADRPTVLAAVRSDGYALAHASVELQVDPEIMRARAW